MLAIDSCISRTTYVFAILAQELSTRIVLHTEFVE